MQSREQHFIAGDSNAEQGIAMQSREQQFIAGDSGDSDAEQGIAMQSREQQFPLGEMQAKHAIMVVDLQSAGNPTAVLAGGLETGKSEGVIFKPTDVQFDTPQKMIKSPSSNYLYVCDRRNHRV
eukprot:1155423-Pelagomonas_calceolata.AAC.4